MFSGGCCGAPAVHGGDHPPLLHVHEEATGRQTQAPPPTAGPEEGSGPGALAGEAAPAPSD